MKSLTHKEILSFFMLSKIEYKLTGDLNKQYYISSIFNIVENGFYFIKMGKPQVGIKNSLILIDQTFEGLYDSSNVYIKTNIDSQVLFYAILAHYFTEVSTGIISDLTLISNEAIIGENVQIDAFTTVGKVIIEDGVIIKNNCYIHDNTFIGKGSVIDSQSVIGAQGVAWGWNAEQTDKIIQPQLGGVEIGSNCFLGSNSIIVRGSLNENTVIGNSCLFAPGCRIGHGSKIDSFVHLANSVITGGNTIIGENSFIGSAAVFRPKVKLHNNTIVGAGAVVIKNTTAPNLTLMGVPAIESITKKNPNGMPSPKTDLKKVII